MRFQAEAVTVSVAVGLANQTRVHPRRSMLVDVDDTKECREHRVKLLALVCRKVLRDALGYFENAHASSHGHRLPLAVHSALAFRSLTLKGRSKM